MRWTRTLRHLRPSQVLGRPLRSVTGKVLPPVLARIGAIAVPVARRTWAPASSELRAHLIREANRVRDRRLRIGFDRALADYEATYARDLPAHVLSNAVNCYPLMAHQQAEALAPFPSSVRARSLALAIRLGAIDVAPLLALSARSIMLQVEWALLGNHILENAIGLVAAGVALEGAEPDVWRRVGSALLGRQLREQFLSDGGHFERSATYHGWLTTALLELWELFVAAGLPFPRAWQTTTERALSWIDRVCAPDGSWPLLNDASLDACPEPLSVLRFARALGAGWTQRANESGMDWLNATGWVIARGCETFVVADVGPIGAPYQPGHAHADSLTFEMWIRGARAVVDPGVAQYGPGIGRSQTRSTAGHSTIEVDHRDSSEVWGEFRVGRRGDAKLLSRWQDRAGLHWTAEHRGYAFLPGRPVHQRTWHVASSSVTVSDSVFGSGEHDLSSVLLFDEGSDAALGLDVQSSSGVSPDRSRTKWFPLHGSARPATRVKIAARVLLPWHHEWVISWKPHSPPGSS